MRLNFFVLHPITDAPGSMPLPNSLIGRPACSLKYDKIVTNFLLEGTMLADTLTVSSQLGSQTTANRPSFPHMHSLPSQESVNRFRIVASLLLINTLVVPALLVLLVYSFISRDMVQTSIILGLLGLCGFGMIIRWFTAARVRCPLCLGAPLTRTLCVKHRNARSVLGSYRLGVALAVIFKGSFRCQYCGESTAIATRSHRHGRR